MTRQLTPKTAAFRSLVQKACTLNAEIATLDAAIRALDAIKARMGDCRDEADARKLLSELTRAEETVTIKRIREPRLKAGLTELLTTAEDAFHPAHAEAGAIAAQTPKQAVSSFRDLLMVVQLDNEHAKTEKANEGAARRSNLWPWRGVRKTTWIRLGVQLPWPGTPLTSGSRG